MLRALLLLSLSLLLGACGQLALDLSPIPGRPLPPDACVPMRETSAQALPAPSGVGVWEGAGWELRARESCRPVVAVLDSGIAPHPDLPEVGSAWNATSSGDPREDEGGHGTSVAGVLAALTGNGIGVASISWNTGELLLESVKVIPGNTLTVAKGLEYARKSGALVVNMSLCLSDSNGECLRAPGVEDAYFERVLARAAAAGVTLVASAGNEGREGVSYPASSNRVLAVGSVNSRGALSRFSNYGPRLEFVAPGEEVLAPLAGGSYGYRQGTSFAAPFVAGEVALYARKFFALEGRSPTPSEVRRCLRASGERAGNPDPRYGYGVPLLDRVLDPGNQDCYP